MNQFASPVTHAGYMQFLEQHATSGGCHGTGHRDASILLHQAFEREQQGMHYIQHVYLAWLLHTCVPLQQPSPCQHAQAADHVRWFAMLQGIPIGHFCWDCGSCCEAHADPKKPLSEAMDEFAEDVQANKQDAKETTKHALQQV